MARYIDADALIEVLQTDFDREGAKAYEYAMQEGMADISIKYSHGQFCFLNAIERVKDTPTADVVPKSEVEKWFRECKELQGRMIELESEVARKIISTIKENFEIGYGGVCEFNKLLDDIEKKYTKSEGEK